MGAITEAMFQKSPRAIALAKNAEEWFGRSSGQARYIDVPLKNPGDWWAATYDKIRPVLDDEQKKTGDSCRAFLKAWLNDWPKNRTHEEQVTGIENRFGELVGKLNVTALGGRPGAKQDDVGRVDAHRKFRDRKTQLP